MNNPVIPPAPVNNAITIQPLTTAVPQQGTAAAQNPLANLANGTIVEGFVINRDAQSNPVLRTPVGDLVVTSEVFLKTGSQVIFRVDATQTSRARIVTVDGLSLQDYSTQNTRGTAEDSIATPTLRGNIIAQAATTTAAAASPFAQPTLQALVLQPLTALLANAQKTTISLQVESDTVPEALKNLPPGTGLKLAVLDLELPPLPVSISNIPEPSIANKLLGQPTTAVTHEAAQVSAAPHAPTAPTRTSATAHSAQAPTQAAASLIANLLSPNDDNVSVPPAHDHLTFTTKNVAPASVQENAPTSALLEEAAPALSKPTVVSTTAPLPTEETAAPLHLETKPSTAAALLIQTSEPHAQTPEQKAAQPLASPPSGDAKQPAAAKLFVATGSELHASVIGHEADGANILHTKFATIKLYTQQPLPTGTTLTLRAEVSDAQAQPQLTPLSDELQGITTLTRDWQHLGDGLNALQTQNPALARDFLQQMPSLGEKLTSNLLFFIAAVRGGDVNEWLGKTMVSRLKFAAPELLKRLDADIGQMQQFFVQSPLNQWSAMMLPMLFGNELQQARLYIRKDDEENKKSGPNDRGQRFIIEVDMSQLGDLQFDGFIRSFDKSKSFDLVIRSSKNLNTEISQGIRDVFENALQLTGLKGQLAFQQGAQHFVRPLADTPSTGSGGSPNTILA